MQEVKYYDELHSDSEKGLRDQKQIKVQKIWCESNQINHLIKTDREIEKGEFTIRNIAWFAAKARRNCNFLYLLAENNNFLHFSTCKKPTISYIFYLKSTTFYTFRVCKH